MPKRTHLIFNLSLDALQKGARLTSTSFYSLANKHFLKVADLSALDNDYYKAITNYERIGRSSINNNLMKWSVKDYLLKAGICHLATKVCPSRPFDCLHNAHLIIVGLG